MAIERTPSGATIVTGKADTLRYAMAVLRTALRSAKEGVRVNPTWTNKMMFGAATRVTGKPYKGRDFDAAISDLTDFIGDRAVNPRYNAEAVQKQIDRDPRIKPREARAIHRVLKGRQA